jgi:hypothetical protein
VDSAVVGAAKLKFFQIYGHKVSNGRHDREYKLFLCNPNRDVCEPAPAWDGTHQANNPVSPPTAVRLN